MIVSDVTVIIEFDVTAARLGFQMWRVLHQQLTVNYHMLIVSCLTVTTALKMNSKMSLKTPQSTYMSLQYIVSV